MNRIASVLLTCVASLFLVFIAPGAPRALVYAANQTQSYVVRPGDTLLAIAVRFDVSVTILQTVNNLGDPDQLQIGQILVIPATVISATGSVTAKRAAATSISHSVQAGDTLSGIALKYDVDTAELIHANTLSDPDHLTIGQIVKVPAAATSAQTRVPAATVELIPLAPGGQGLAPAPIPTSIPVQVPAAVSDDVDGMRAEMLALYNQVRAANGLPALAYSVVLQQSAQGHADDCSMRGQGSHTGSDGSLPSQRIARAGYAGRITGENWAWSRSVGQTFDMWFYQELPNGPHLKNILNARYTEVGFGISASNGGYYFIANFGAP